MVMTVNISLPNRQAMSRDLFEKLASEIKDL